MSKIEVNNVLNLTQKQRLKQRKVVEQWIQNKQLELKCYILGGSPGLVVMGDAQRLWVEF